MNLLTINARLVTQLARTVAALDTHDLSEVDRGYVLRDAFKLLDEIKQQPADVLGQAATPVRVLLDLRNGVVQQVTADDNVQMIVLDHALAGKVGPRDLVARISGEDNPMVPWLSVNRDALLVTTVFAQLHGQIEHQRDTALLAAFNTAPTPAHAQQASERIQQLAGEQGWNSDTMLSCLESFLGRNPAVTVAFAAHLQDVADAENEPGETETPPGQSCDDFERDFGEAILAPSGDLLGFNDVKGLDPHEVWSIVDGDDGNSLWALPGFRVVNHTGGYVRTSRPWITGDEQYRWDD